MKLSAAVIAAIVGFVAAQDISQIPECAQDCITEAIASGTSCGATDYKCVCENKSALVGAATPCVIKACGADVATGEVLPATEKFCKEVEEGGSSGGQSSAAETTAAAPTTSAAEETPSTTAGEETTPTETASNGGYPTASSTPTGGSNTTNPSPTSSVPVPAGAAAVGSMGGFAMLALAAAAAL